MAIGMRTRNIGPRTATYAAPHRMICKRKLQSAYCVPELDLSERRWCEGTSTLW